MKLRAVAPASLDANAAQPKRERKGAAPSLSSKDLPFGDGVCTPSGDSCMVHWRLELQPALLDWFGTLERPFAANGHVNLKPTIRKLWNIFFSFLDNRYVLPGTTVEVHRIDHPAIYAVVSVSFD